MGAGKGAKAHAHTRIRPGPLSALWVKQLPLTPRRLAQQEGEIAALGKALAGLHSETARLNALLAETTGLHTSLNEDNSLLEARITNQLKVQWAWAG